MKFPIQFLVKFFFPISVKEFLDYCSSWLIISGISLPLVWLILHIEQRHMKAYWLFVFTVIATVAYSYVFRSLNFRQIEFRLSPKLILNSILPLLALITLLILADGNYFGFDHAKPFGLIAGLTCFWSSQAAIVIRLLIEKIVKRMKELRRRCI